MSQRSTEAFLKEIRRAVHSHGSLAPDEGEQQGLQYSQSWVGLLRGKGTYSLKDMCEMRSPHISITQGFGVDRRFSPSWDYFRTDPDYHGLLDIPEPEFGNPEMIFRLNGSPPHSGTFLRNAAYAYRIVTACKKKRSEPLRILEIGPGFGMLALILKTHYPKARFVLVDLAESLEISAWYLLNVFEEASYRINQGSRTTGTTDVDFEFVTAGRFEVGMGEYDIVVNTDSMSEMIRPVAQRYLDIAEKDLKPGGIFFFLNKEAVDPQAAPRPTAYSFPADWLVRSIAPSLMGFIDDHRHIEIIFERSSQTLPGASLRNKLLDASYSVFSQGNPACFLFFDLVAHWPGDLPDHLSDSDLWDNIFQSENRRSWCRLLEALAQKHADGKGVKTLTTALLLGAFMVPNRLRADDVRMIANRFNKAADPLLVPWALAWLHLGIGDERSASAFLNEALAAARLPNGHHELPPSLLCYYMAKVLSASGHDTLAERAFHKVLEISPYLIERLYAARPLGSKAETEIERMLPLPNEEDYLNIGYYRVRLARLYTDLGCPDLARAHLEPLIRGTLLVGAYDAFETSRILDDLGEDILARTMLARAEEAGSRDNGFLRQVGLQYLAHGELGLALKFFRQSLDLDPSWASTHYDISRVYRELGDHAVEREHLSLAKSLSFNREVDYAYLDARLPALGSIFSHRS